MGMDTWEQQTEAARKQKDDFFGSHPQSPLPLNEQARFRGLDYWPPDPAYRYELELHEHSDRQAIEVADTGGRIRKLYRWGEFRFELAGRQCVLQAYKSDPGGEEFFIPFRDATSGRESHGAGRYLDLGPDARLPGGSRWVFDLNAAYNPWCAYSDAYACPLVPPENILDVPVRAGEKSYPLKSGEKAK